MSLSVCIATTTHFARPFDALEDAQVAKDPSDEQEDRQLDAQAPDVADAAADAERFVTKASGMIKRGFLRASVVKKLFTPKTP